MLQIVIPEMEYWDEFKSEFVVVKAQSLQLEHSLISISKWESKWCKPFLHTPDISHEQLLDYVRCMTLTQNIKDEVYDRLSDENLLQIKQYIESPMTATTFSDKEKGKGGRKIITSEVIYHWMVALNIPFECAKWHLNRLITLIRICNIENEPKKNMSKKDIMSRNRALNNARKNKLNTRG